MAEETSRSVSCSGCGSELDEPSSTLVDDRAPCPNCGLLARTFRITLESKLDIRSSLRLRGKPERGRWFIDHFAGDDLWRKTGRWMRKVRRIDRRADEYHEVVSDPKTGEIAHETHERLSDHRGHGSARGEMATLDELGSVWEEVEQELARRNFAVFPAPLEPANGSVAIWPESSSVSEFLDLAERLGVRSTRGLGASGGGERA